MTNRIITAVTANMPSIPRPIRGSEFRRFSMLIFIVCLRSPYASIERRSPPAMTDAICPETLTPTACIKRKF